MAEPAQQQVAVAVRIRPVIRGGSAMHEQEQFEPVAASREGDTGVHMQEHKLDEACRSNAFQFDFVFDSDSTQLEVYEDSVVDLVDAALQTGSSATILAYGQTGSGKTHSMIGDVRPNPLDDQLLTPQSGIFLRVLADLLAFRDRRMDKTHVVIGLSCVEIYNEKVRDLFGGAKPEDPPPTIKAIMVEDQVILKDLITKEVASLQSVFNELQLAIQRRQSRATGANKESSRSHCLFTVDVMLRDANAERPTVEMLAVAQQAASKRGSPTPMQPTMGDDNGWQGLVIPVGDGGPPVRCSRVVIADLAGSEKIRNSGVTGAGFAEATSINSSLTALGNVVHALHDGKLASYRDSQLTRLLKPSFSSPASRVLLLAQIAPTQLTYDESMSTLHFANKVKAVKMVSDPSVETDRLPFEYLASARTLLTLTGELAVWAAQTGCRPTLRSIGASMRSGPPFWTHDKDSRPRPGKERLQALLDAGAEKHYLSMRDAAARAQEEDDRRFEATLGTLQEHRRQQAIKAHTEQVAVLEAQIREERLEGAALRLDDVTIAQSAGREQIDADAETAFLAIEEAHAAAMRSLVSSTETSLKELEKEAATMARRAGRATSHVSADERAEMAADDERFAAAVYHHCNARRILNGCLDLRDAQGAFAVASHNYARLSAWVARNKLGEPKQEGSGEAQ